MSAKAATPFPFIVGRGRSGTTLLRAMLDSHPDMAVPPESHVLARIGRTRSRFERDVGFDRELFINRTRKVWIDRWGLTLDEVEGALSSPDVVDVPSAIRHLFAAYAGRRGKSRYAEKTPVNVLHMPLIASMFPESRFVHLVRDGRDVALSYVSVDFGPGTISEAALGWRRAVERGRRDGLALGADRYHELTYEELVRDPEPVLRGLCAFIDLTYDASMLRYFERAGSVRRSIHGSAHRRLDEPPSVSRDWRAEMGTHDLAVFEAIAGGTLERFGYERGVDRIPAIARIGAGLSYCAINVARASAHAKKRVRKIRKRLTR